MLKAKIGCKHENKRNIIDHAKEYYNQKVGKYKISIDPSLVLALAQNSGQIIIVFKKEKEL